MCEELEKCYGTDGITVRQTYMKDNGVRSDIPEYNSYKAAYKRCNNPNSISYDHYKSRGIEFRFNSFTEWWAELGRKPTSLHTVDRINNRGHYEVGNVRWATRLQQSTNCEHVRGVRITHPDGSHHDFQSIQAAGRETVGIGKSSIHLLCHSASESVNGYTAKFIPKLTKE